MLSSAFAKSANALSAPSIPFDEYISTGWSIIEPNTPLLRNWHIDAIAEYLQAIALGQIKKLVINIPPRYGKSNLISVLFPTWFWTSRPWLRMMFFSYSQRLANDHSRKRRDLVQSPWYQEKWGSLVSIARDQNQKVEFENLSRGSFFATSIGGTATGKGGDGIVIDDGINPKEAESEVERESALEFVRSSLSTRLNDKRNGFIIEVSQRTHHADISAFLLAHGYTHLCLPVICTLRTMIELPISKRQIVREVGDLLHPDREDIATLDDQKGVMGSRTFSAQYQQDPASDDSAMVNREWWKFYKEDPNEIAATCDIVGQSWDFAFKDTQEGSYVCGLVGGRRGADLFILDQYRDHWDFPATIKAIKRASIAWPKALAKWYEDRANGPAVKAQAQKEITGLIPVEPIGSKSARMAAASPVIESGNVYLPNPRDINGRIIPRFSWVLDFIEEIAHFPKEPNDRGDSLSQLILKIMNIQIFQEDFIDEGAMMEGLGSPQSRPGDFDANFIDPNEELYGEN